jgi:hypothetical protein
MIAELKKYLEVNGIELRTKPNSEGELFIWYL